MQFYFLKSDIKKMEKTFLIQFSKTCSSVETFSRNRQKHSSSLIHLHVSRIQKKKQVLTVLKWKWYLTFYLTFSVLDSNQ